MDDDNEINDGLDILKGSFDDNNNNNKLLSTSPSEIRIFLSSTFKGWLGLELVF